MDIYKLDEQTLDKAFNQAYIAVSNTDYKFEQDTLLYFYGYYKHATKEFSSNDYSEEPTDGEKLVNAFKINALFQVRQLSEEECKRKYVELAIKYLGKDFLRDII